MQQILGNFLEVIPTDHSSLEISFNSPSETIKKAWINIRLTAHFLAEYFANTVLANQANQANTDLQENIQAIKSSVLYISNELLENAEKYSDKTENYQLKLGIHYLGEQEENTVVIFTQNRINQQMFNRLQDLIHKLLSTEDLNELYVQQIEASTDESSDVSGLGLLTIMNDYSASLGWKFQAETNNSQMYTVTTMAQFTL